MVFHATAAMASRVQSACGVSSSHAPERRDGSRGQKLRRRTLQQRHAAAEPPEIERSPNQSRHSDQRQHQTAKPGRTFQCGLAHDETDAHQSQRQPQPLPRAQSLAKDHQAEGRRQQRRQGLHERDLGGWRHLQADMRPHQADGIQQRPGNRTMQPSPLRERLPRPAQEKHQRREHDCASRQPDGNEQQWRQMPQADLRRDERRAPEQDEQQRREPVEHSLLLMASLVRSL